MSDQPPVYGLDLITNATGPLVDPDIDAITNVGLSGVACDEVFGGAEAEMLEALDHRLLGLPAGVIATWHGSILALPLLMFRANHCTVSLGLRVELDRRQAPPSPVVGIESALRGSWHHHQLLDLRRVYEQQAEPRRWNPLARSRGAEESLIPSTNDLASRDPGRDARLVRQLAERRWNQAKRYVDVVPAEAVELSDLTANSIR